MRSVKLGIIGLGLIWQRVHKTILTEQQAYFVPTAFCDLSEERRQATAAAFPNAPVVADYHELLQMPELDVIQVLTPIAYNAPTALAALEAGKDVIVEKPIARSVAEGQQLLDTARRLGRRLYITEQVAYRQAEAVVTTLLAEGAITSLWLNGGMATTGPLHCRQKMHTNRCGRRLFRPINKGQHPITHPSGRCRMWRFWKRSIKRFSATQSWRFRPSISGREKNALQ